MKLNKLEQYITTLFDARDNEHFNKQSGFTVKVTDEIKKIGYCTNLTLDIIEEAKKSKQGIY